MRFVILLTAIVALLAVSLYLARYRYRGHHTPSGIILRDAEWRDALRSMGAWRREVRTI